jgi:5-methylcytosine-specific restriction protein B
MRNPEANWFLSSTFNGEDQTFRFIEEGIWDKNIADKYDEMVNSIRIGDRVVLKNTHNQVDNIPFDFKGKIVSVMEIKALGLVKRNYFNGRKIEVEWKKRDLNKIWYFYTYMRSIWRVESQSPNWMCKALIDFTFDDKPQDVQRFINEPYWKNRLHAGEKVTCIDEIMEVLEILGGEAHLSVIQDEIEKRNRLETIKTSPHWRAEIRFTLQRFCSDSKSFAHGEDYFYSQSFSSGIWGLRALQSVKPEVYTEEQFFKDVYMYDSKYHEIESLLKEKKSIMIKGYLGNEKSYFADKLAFSFMGVKDKNRLTVIQLSECLSEKQGKQETDFFITEGCFLDFSRKAAEDSDNDYFFIIDEICWENLNKAMGDLILLFKRDACINICHKSRKCSKDYFYIPENIYIVGILDSSNKNMSMIDHLLKRHFNFVEIEPFFNVGN